MREEWSRVPAFLELRFQGSSTAGSLSNILRTLACIWPLADHAWLTG